MSERNLGEFVRRQFARSKHHLEPTISETGIPLQPIVSIANAEQSGMATITMVESEHFTGFHALLSATAMGIATGLIHAVENYAHTHGKPVCFEANRASMEVPFAFLVDPHYTRAMHNTALESLDKKENGTILTWRSPYWTVDHAIERTVNIDTTRVSPLHYNTIANLLQTCDLLSQRPFGSKTNLELIWRHNDDYRPVERFDITILNPDKKNGSRGRIVFQHSAEERRLTVFSSATPGGRVSKQYSMFSEYLSEGLGNLLGHPVGWEVRLGAEPAELEKTLVYAPFQYTDADTVFPDKPLPKFFLPQKSPGIVVASSDYC